MPSAARSSAVSAGRSLARSAEAAGAAIGAVVGAGTGAAIASEGERRRSGYYAYQRGCYMQRPDGYYVRLDQRYCY